MKPSFTQCEIMWDSLIYLSHMFILFHNFLPLLLLFLLLIIQTGSRDSALKRKRMLNLIMKIRIIYLMTMNSYACNSKLHTYIFRYFCIHIYMCVCFNVSLRRFTPWRLQILKSYLKYSFRFKLFQFSAF